MKIGILTQPLTHNYGGLLQNWALQQVLIREKHEVETLDHINYGKIDCSFYHEIKSWIRYCVGKQGKPKYQLSKSEKNKIYENTNYFIDSYIKRTKILRSERDFVVQGRVGKYDAYVVGSDQCWRPCYNSEALQDMFLSFVSQDCSVKRIAYAVSFGTDKWEFSSQQTANFAHLSQKFDLVTVREDSGVSLCNKYLGVVATQVLDPTMLLKKEDYAHLVYLENESGVGGGLFNYILDPSEKKRDFVNHVAASANLRPFRVLPKYQAEIRSKSNVRNSIEDCVFPRVTTWLRAFMDAEMVIVDSFHGMVFSIIFNKPFWVIGNEERGLSRFISLLKTFNLEDRLLDVNQLGCVDYSRPVDWSSVNNLLEQKRNESKNILLNSLQ